MYGQMMDRPLLITEIMRFSERHRGDGQVVSVTVDNPHHRCTYRDVFRRARQVAQLLSKLQLQQGDRVATIAWNDYRHLELYYGVSCSGYVLHTVNPRLAPDEIVFIMNHAEDRVLFVDPLCVPLIEALRDKLPKLEKIVVLTSPNAMPETSMASIECYETLLAEQPETFDWPELEERTASALCYTSGTTGRPKGVLYSHRSTVLHTFACLAADAMGCSKYDVVLPVVPMFHVHGWGTPYALPAVGGKFVLPGAQAGNPEVLTRLINEEQVTAALGVPTIWLNLLKYLRETNQTVPTLKRTVVGGSACPESIMEEFEECHGVLTHHAWGMTETSPLGTLGVCPADSEMLPEPERRVLRLKQGRAPFGIDLKIVDDRNQELPWDGETAGQLKVRGWWVCDGYYECPPEDWGIDAEGWFNTGDVATIDPAGNMCITDRTKDLIKSGGEWISSVELENIAVAHPDVLEAAAIAIPHDTWGERPLLVVILEEDTACDKQTILDWYQNKVAKWAIPQDVTIVDELPHTATGKLDKLTLRAQFAEQHANPDKSK